MWLDPVTSFADRVGSEPGGANVGIDGYPHRVSKDEINNVSDREVVNPRNITLTEFLTQDNVGVHAPRVRLVAAAPRLRVAPSSESNQIVRRIFHRAG